MKIGQPKQQGADYVQTKYFELKDGESVFRILPPLGELAEQGRWSVYYAIHYGYTNAEGKLRVFASPLVKNNKTKMIEVPDAALERLDTLKAQLDKAKQDGNQAIVERLTKLVGQFSKTNKPKYNLDKHYYLNAIDSQGNIGVLKLRHKAKVALDELIKTLAKDNVIPHGQQEGRYLNFKRTGMGNETNFSVSVAQETVTVEGYGAMKRDLVHSLSEELVTRIGKEARELNTLYKTPSADDVALIVANSDLLTGRTPNIDDILGIKAKAAYTAASKATTVAVETDDNSSDDASDTEATPAVEAAPAVASTATKKASKAKEEVKVTAPAAKTTPASPINQMSDEDFLSYMNAKS